MNDNDLAWIATGRKRSLFQQDYDACRMAIEQAVCDRRVLIIGGAGSIGSATIRQLLPFRPRALHVVDIDENGLAELVRDLRCSRLVHDQTEVRFLPLDYGSPIMRRFLSDQQPYDLILNFAAVKHVRSEKDVYSILHMYETNVLKMYRFLQWANEFHGPVSFFSVSTDKAANPVNFMGASKRLMEHVMFSNLPYQHTPMKVTSARFANVAFSSGSLLASWLTRMEKLQPLAVPVGTRRYFISGEEAGNICMIASITGEHGSILVPSHELIELTLLEDVLKHFLSSRGLDPWYLDSESEALDTVSEALQQRRYPVVRTLLDTSGEKPFEEFCGAQEEAKDCSLAGLEAINYASGVRPDTEALLSVLRSLEGLVAKPDPGALNMSRLVDLVRQVVPDFAHNTRSKSLDERI
jgi:FlaA1/EpsC-like NDP-sugar epimerase